MGVKVLSEREANSFFFFLFFFFNISLELLRVWKLSRWEPEPKETFDDAPEMTPSL